MSSFKITPEQVEFYEREGYLLIKHHGFANPADLQKWTQEVMHWPLETGKWMPYLEINTRGEQQIMRTEKFVEYHDGFRSLLCGPDVLTMLKTLTGKELVLFKDKVNYKLPGGNGFRAHLDAPAYNHMGNIVHTNIMVTIDAQTTENGCLEVVPGSHKMDVPLVNNGQIDPDWEANHEWVKVPAEAGDFLIFGSIMAHRSGPNSTSSQRAACFATYNFKEDGEDLRQNYYEHRRKYFPPDHERVEGEDYKAGTGMYGFAAPFTKATPVEAM